MISIPHPRPFLRPDWDAACFEDRSPAQNTKALRRFPQMREPNAGPVSLTMTRFSYLIFRSSSNPAGIFAACPPKLRHLVVYARTRPLPEVSFLVARLQHSRFCITTLTFPVNRSDRSNRSMDADNTSADFTFLRNSPKFLSSLMLFVVSIMFSSLEQLAP
jgi:hypothetical protein